MMDSSHMAESEGVAISHVLILGSFKHLESYGLLQQDFYISECH